MKGSPNQKEISEKAFFVTLEFISGSGNSLIS
jgi:hypothetical protein